MNMNQYFVLFYSFFQLGMHSLGISYAISICFLLYPYFRNYNPLVSILVTPCFLYYYYPCSMHAIDFD